VLRAVQTITTKRYNCKNDHKIEKRQEMDGSIKAYDFERVQKSGGK